MNSPSLDPVREVFEQWELYDAIIRGNYMLHAEISSGVRERLARNVSPSTVLDLGCGDGEMARLSLQNLDVARYVAIDLSAEALRRLERATPEATPEWNDIRELHQGDFAEVLLSLATDRFDVVLANYSLHHFNRQGKAGLLAQIVRVLKPGGVLIWTDVVLEAGESREEYLSRLDREMSHEWISLTQEQRKRGVAHIWESDFPEPLAWMKAELETLTCRYECELVRNSVFGSWVFQAEL